MVLNPLGIEELLDRCVEFLSDGPSDLEACALVSRLWAYVAQRYLFREITVTRSTRCWWLNETLPTAPHLIPHIRHLSVYPTDYIVSEACRFPFTHLESVFIMNLGTISLPCALAMQNLFRLPTLRRINLGCGFIAPSDLLKIWDRCSPSIKHLALDIGTHGNWRGTLDATPGHSSPPIQLESFQIAQEECVSEWLTHDLCPFDFSNLKALSLYTETDILRLPKFAPALQTIETLDFVTTDNYIPIDLSSLPNLSLLRIFVPSAAMWPVVHSTIAAVAPSSAIRRIVISFDITVNMDSMDLDATPTALTGDHPPTVELEMSELTYINTAPYFRQATPAERPSKRWNWTQLWPGLID
ncbi:hypothetical protein DFH09DRAFT_1165247 [Mycena vulgaris]|nr:hypothetical protein DFH09DRAFT_1165247 [Mycena vulgaris]